MTTATTSRSEMWNRDFIILMVVNLCMYIPIYMLNTSLAGYVTSLNGGPALAGTIASAFSITAFIGYLVAGPALDAGNRKIILVLSLVLMAVAIAGYAVFDNIAAVLFFRLVQGFGLAFSTTSFLVVVTQSLPSPRVTAGIRYFTMVMVIGQAIGPYLGVNLAAGVGFRGVFVTDVVFMLVGAALACFTSNGNATPRPEGRRRVFRNPIALEAVPGSILLALTSIGFFVLAAFMVVYAQSRGIGSAIGYFFAVYAVTLLVVNPLVTGLVRRIGLMPVLVASFALQAIALVLLATSTQLWEFFLVAVLFAAGYGVSMPLVKAIVMDSVPAERHGVASSTSNLAVDIGTLIGGTFGGVLVAAVGYPGMWLIVAIPVVASVVLVFPFRKSIVRADRIEASPTSAGGGPVTSTQH